MKYAIVGFGTAGYHALKAIRTQDPKGEIDVYTNTSMPPYNPMLTTYYAVGKLEYEGMFPFGSLEAIQKEFPFELHQEEAIKVHSEEHSVETANGQKEYDRILIATGARAFAPPVKGLKPENAYLMRTVEDAQRLKERLQQGDVKNAIVVGASMVGIKVVEVLQKQGINTWLLDLAPYIFPLAAYPQVAQVIQERVEQQGVHLKFSVTIDHMEEEDGKQIAVLTDGSRIPTDIVGLCIGTRTNTQVVDEKIALGKGIIVDQHMQTNVPGIYAAGDCCEGNNLENGQTQLIGLWANANRQGTTAGSNMAGQEMVYEGNILHNITNFMEMDFIGFGDNRIEGEVLEYGTLGKGMYIRLVLKDHRIAGANILDNCSISGIVKNYMLRLFGGDTGKLPVYQCAALESAGLSSAFLDELEGKIHGCH